MAKRKAPTDRRERVKGELKSIFLEIMDDPEVRAKMTPPPAPEEKEEEEEEGFSLSRWLLGKEDSDTEESEEGDEDNGR